MNVILQGDGSPFGVLEVDSKSEGEFSEHDLAFLQGAANILGMAIEQQQYQRKLQAALDRHQVLLKKVNHRVKNSLQVVSATLQLQANAVGDQAVSERLNEAASWANAVGRAYERLAYNADYENIDLIEYLREIIGDLELTVAPCEIQFDAPEAIQFAADRAILVGLIINELVSNAGKYAYPDCLSGTILVRVLLQSDNQAIVMSVQDEGVGLPPGFDLATSKRLGTRLVNALAKQLGGELTPANVSPWHQFNPPYSAWTRHYQMIAALLSFLVPHSRGSISDVRSWPLAAGTAALLSGRFPTAN